MLLCVTNVVRTPNDQWHSLMKLLGLDVEDAHGAGAGPSPCLLYDPR
jgi:hypothetical protein